MALAGSSESLRAFLVARVQAAGAATVGFLVWALLEPGSPAWSLVVAAALFTVSSLVQLRRRFAHPATPVIIDAVVVFGGVLVARPFPGAEATALALVMTSAVVFARGQALRWVVPALATAAAVEGLVNWELRTPPAWSTTGMVVNAAIATVAVVPIIVWMAGFVARAFQHQSLYVSLLDDPGVFANAVTETSSEGIAVIDGDSTIHYANPAFAAMFGFSRDELAGNSLAMVMEPATYARHHRAVTEAMASSRRLHATNLELVGRHRSGRPVTVLVSFSELAGDERLILGAVRDVTEMVRLRRRLQDMIDSKDEFIASVSHELRTPITAVVAFTDLLRENPDLDPVERDEYIGLVADQAQDVGFLIEDLLVGSRLDSESLIMTPERTDLRTEVTDAARPWASQCSIRVDSASTDVAVFVHPRRFRQIIRNLVSNAVKYGGGQIEIVAETDDGRCRVIVRDNGEGVAPGSEEAIFEPYEHAASVPGQPPSIGLGLPVSRRLAEAMGGSLHYRRRAGHTEFVCELPLAGR